MCDFVEMKTITISKMADGVPSKSTEEYSKDKKIIPDVLTELNPVFGEIIYETFELLERKVDGITEIHSNTSKRTIFNVRGHGPTFDVNYYIILPTSCRCSYNNWIYNALTLGIFPFHKVRNEYLLIFHGELLLNLLHLKIISHCVLVFKSNGLKRERETATCRSGKVKTKREKRNQKSI